MVEAWGDDVPEGKVTDFHSAVEAKDDETVVFSWFEYPDKATRDAANEKMMSDPRMKEMGANMPFDGKRMIMGGFDAIVEEGSDGTPAIPTASSCPSRTARRTPIASWPQKMAAKFKEHGALRVVEAWGDDVPDGKVTDYNRAVKAEDGENIVYSYVEWPDKATRDAGWEKIMADPSMKPSGDMPFDGKRMFWGGFEPILDTAKPSSTPRQRRHAVNAPLRRSDAQSATASFIWYELMTPDPAAAKRFYDAVVGWNIDAEPVAPAIDYRMIERGDGGNAGGVLTLTDEMRRTARGRSGSATSTSTTSMPPSPGDRGRRRQGA